MKTDARVVLIGATGYTGRLVARELAGGELPFLLTGRGADRLARLAEEVGGADTQQVDVTEPASLRRALRAGDVVINCAGPFTDLGEPVVEACVRAGAHYLDTTGEQRFMKSVFDRFDDEARRAGVIVVNGMAFEYAIGDCAAALAAEGLTRPLRSVDMVYAWGGGAAASRGTRLSIMRVLREGGFTYRNGNWEPQPTGAESRTVQLAGATRSVVSFPAGEILTVPRHIPVDTVRAWMVMDRATATALPLAASVMPTLIGVIEPIGRWLLQQAAEGPTPEQRQASRFRIRAEAVDADGQTQSVTAEGHDPYGVTAHIAVYGARQVLQASGEIAGVLAPAQVLRTPAFRSMLETWGTVWTQDRETSA